MRLSVVGAALAATLVTSAAQATSLSTIYSSFFVFGDSLSDVGNVFAATGGTLPPPTITIGGTDFPGYFQGRVSNGPVWAEGFSEAFAAAGKPTRNFAFALANAATNGDLVPDLPAQIGLFAATTSGVPLGPNPLGAVLVGANDLFGVINAGPTVAAAEAAGIATAQAVGVGLLGLFGLGFNDFLLFNLPDLGAVPAYALFDPAKVPAASAATAAFNAALAGQAAGLRGLGANVIEVDLAGLFADLLADPGLFGLVDVVFPCIVGSVSQQQFLSVCDPATNATRAFFDPIHPTAAVHAQIALAVEGAAVAPIPVPAALPLLVSALGALVLVRRRSSGR